MKYLESHQGDEMIPGLKLKIVKKKANKCRYCDSTKLKAWEGYTLQYDKLENFEDITGIEKTKEKIIKLAIKNFNRLYIRKAWYYDCLECKELFGVTDEI